MRAIQSPSTDPRFNLALEQYIFDQMPRNRSYLMLWRNDQTIVVGKPQITGRQKVEKSKSLPGDLGAGEPGGACGAERPK